MSDYSTTCPWTFLGEMVEGGSFPKELFSKLQKENSAFLWKEQENKKLEEELSVSNTALEMVKDENEVNKKNMMKFMSENKKLKEDLEKAWDQRGDKWRKARIKNLDEENKELKEEIERLRGYFGVENKKLKDDYQELKEENKNLKDQVFHGTTKDEIKEIYRVTMKLQEENKKLKEDLERMKRWTDRALRDNEELKEEKEILCKFLGGNYDEGSAVEEILKGYFSEDFIKANKETWDYYQIFQ